MGLTAWIKKADFISQVPTFTYRGQERFTSVIGGIQSMLGLIFIFGVSLYFLIQVMGRENISVIYNREISTDIPILNLTGTPFLIGVYGQDGKPISPERTYSITSVRYRIDIINSPNGTVSSSVSVLPVKLIPCEESLFFEKYKASLIAGHQEYTNKSCFDQNEDLKIYGSFTGTTKKHFIVIYLSRCVNSTLNNNSCFSNLMIDTILSRPVISMQNLDYVIDNKNISSPGNPYIQSDTLSFNSKIYKWWNYQFEMVEYESDNGFIFQDIKQSKFFQKNPTMPDVLLPGEGDPLLVSLSLSMSIFKSSYDRSYLKLQGLLANIGGISKATTTFFNILNTFFFDYLYWLSLSNAFSLFYRENSGRIDKRRDSKKLKFIPFENDLTIHSRMFMTTKKDYSSHKNINNKKGIELSKPGKLEKKSDLSDMKQPNISQPGLLAVRKIKSNLELPIIDIIFKKASFKKSSRLQLLNKAETYLKRKTCIEEFVFKMFDIDKMKYILFEKDLLNLFPFMMNSIDTNEVTKKNPLYDYYAKYEFSIENKHEGAQESYEYLLRKESKSNKEKKVLAALSNIEK
jgi:hypothetical protein